MLSFTRPAGIIFSSGSISFVANETPQQDHVTEHNLTFFFRSTVFRLLILIHMIIFL